jgi:hypothetical protein
MAPSGRDSNLQILLILGNSQGYIPSPDGDRGIPSDALRLLKRGGRLLVDIVNSATPRSRFNPAALQEIGDDIVACRSRCLDGAIARGPPSSEAPRPQGGASR